MNHELVLAFPLSSGDGLSPAALAALRKRALGRPSRREIAVTWFDTPDHALAGRDLFAKLETRGKRRFQRFESIGLRLAPVRDLQVWESAAAGEAPRFEAIPDESLQVRLEDLEEDLLAPVFHADLTRIERRLRADDGGIILAQVEQGELRAGERTAPLRRLVLRGDASAPAGFFALARELAAALPAGPDARGLGQRGHDLAAGKEPAAARRRASDLGPETTVEDTMAAMLRQGLDQALGNLACVLETTDPEGIHQMRVGLRRTRSTLRLFRKLLPAAQYDWLVGEIKWLTSQLGPARDMDVFEEEIAAPVMAGAPDGASFEVFVRRIRAERRKRRQAAHRALTGRRWRDFQLEAAAWLAARGWRAGWGPDLPAALNEPIAGFAAKRLARRHRTVHQDARRFHDLAPAERHQLRIDVKKLRYALDFFAPLYPERRVTRYLERLSGLQDALGYLNDVTVARGLIDGLCANCKPEALVRCLLAGGLVLGWHAHGAATVEASLKVDLAAFLRAKPFWTTG